MIGLLYGEENYDNMLSRFHTMPERNGRTDRRTDRHNCYINRVSVLTLDKNTQTQYRHRTMCYDFLFVRSLLKFFCLHPSLYLLVSWAWWYWPLMWLTNHRPSVLWHCWLGHVTSKTVSKMTYNVSSVTLNYYTYTFKSSPGARAWIVDLGGQKVKDTSIKHLHEIPTGLPPTGALNTGGV